MSNDIDVDLYVREPESLVELFRNVIDRIDSVSNGPKTTEMEAQLREIAKAVENLERTGVPVPDALRAEKIRLVAKIGLQTQESEKSLTVLADGLNVIIRDFNTRLGRTNELPEPKKPRKKRSRLPKTEKKVLREHIIQALKKLGGSARVSAVIEEMGCQLDGKLLPGDLEWRESTKEHAWQNNTKWERYNMTQDGTLRSNSPRGYWELGEGQQ